MRYIQTFSTRADVGDALDNGLLGKPYVAYIANDDELDFNSVGEAQFEFVETEIDAPYEGGTMEAHFDTNRSVSNYSFEVVDGDGAEVDWVLITSVEDNYIGLSFLQNEGTDPRECTLIAMKDGEEIASLLCVQNAYVASNVLFKVKVNANGNTMTQFALDPNDFPQVSDWTQVFFDADELYSWIDVYSSYFDESGGYPKGIITINGSNDDYSSREATLKVMHNTGAGSEYLGDVEVTQEGQFVLRYPYQMASNSDAQSGKKIYFTFNNGNSLQFSTDADWVTFTTVSSNSATCNLDANDSGEMRSAYVEISYNGEQIGETVIIQPASDLSSATFTAEPTTLGYSGGTVTITPSEVIEGMEGLGLYFTNVTGFYNPIDWTVNEDGTFTVYFPDMNGMSFSKMPAISVYAGVGHTRIGSAMTINIQE